MSKSLKNYSIPGGGWSPLRRDCFAPVNNEYDDYKKSNRWREIVTKEKDIKVFLDPGRVSDDIESSYHKTFHSENGFTIGRIFSLIVETYMSSIDDLFDGDKEANDNLSLTNFSFDKDLLSVYPSCDS